VNSLASVVSGIVLSAKPSPEVKPDLILRGMRIDPIFKKFKPSVISNRFMYVGFVESVGDVGNKRVQGAIVEKLDVRPVVQVPLEIVPPCNVGRPGSKHAPVLVQLEHPQNRLHGRGNAVAVIHIAPIIANDQEQQECHENFLGHLQSNLGRLFHIGHGKTARLVLKKLFLACGGNAEIDHDARREIRAFARGETTRFHMRRSVEFRVGGLHVIVRRSVVDDVVVENERHELKDFFGGTGSQEEVKWIQNW